MEINKLFVFENLRARMYWESFLDIEIKRSQLKCIEGKISNMLANGYDLSTIKIKVNCSTERKEFSVDLANNHAVQTIYSTDSMPSIKFEESNYYNDKVKFFYEISDSTLDADGPSGSPLSENNTPKMGSIIGEMAAMEQKAEENKLNKSEFTIKDMSEETAKALSDLFMDFNNKYKGDVKRNLELMFESLTLIGENIDKARAKQKAADIVNTLLNNNKTDMDKTDCQEKEAKEPKFKRGDLVIHVTGSGPVMSVTEILEEPENTFCTSWFCEDKKEFAVELFKETSLKLFEKKEIYGCNVEEQKGPHQLNEPKFKPGYIARLMSGGPDMAVYWADQEGSGEVSCCWYEGPGMEMQYGDFNEKYLYQVMLL